MLLQFPYESFKTSVERFLRTASSDPKVLAIKLSIYRTSSQSPIIQALMEAANRGAHEAGARWIVESAAAAAPASGAALPSYHSTAVMSSAKTSM